MPNEKKTEYESGKKQPIKGGKNPRGLVEHEIEIPETLEKVKSFLKTEINKPEKEEVERHSILYLKEDQLISPEKDNLGGLTPDDILVLKKLIRDVVKEELDNRELTK